ncbi:hypothetical protein HF086_007265 [Spodoptera exigua]|uniref:Uncharacterized protein n=1 Tax=Spodoptera exigua TaxID=7107 RepID=A0A922MPT3_SPOEX|nr:hypothetical protein HF086_007265 [Spodoptera exigua]
MSDMIINDNSNGLIFLDSVPVDKKWNELIRYNIFIMKLVEFVSYINGPHDYPVCFDGACHLSLPGRCSDPRLGDCVRRAILSGPSA